MKGNLPKIIVICVITALALLFFAFDLQQYLTIDYLKAQQLAFADYYAHHTGFTIAAYMFIYIIVTALSLPGATVMTLAGGALFGLWLGLLLISFASTVGATLAFLVARFLLRDFVQRKFGDKLTAINAGVEKEGAFYLFTLRLIPIFPFFIINLVMGLTPIRTVTYYIVSQIGMLAGTFVYVNAGTQLGKIDSLKGILSPGLLFSFALLGIFPIAAKKLITYIKARKVLAEYPRPEKFDYNLAVIGAGSAGLVSSYIAAAVRAKVVLIEKDKMGGDCLNTGCVPSKALIRSAKILTYAKRASEFGFSKVDLEFDFADVMARVHQIIKKIEPHDSIERYTRLGVDCIQGEALVTSPYTIAVNDRVITARSIIIATGARPFIPPVPGLDKIDYLTSDNIWKLKKLPNRLMVLGGGPIGCEMTQAFARLGSLVMQVEMAPRIMGREDVEVSEMVKDKFEQEGIQVLTGHRAKSVITEDSRKILVCDHNGEEVRFEFDEILVAVGRAANTKGFGLEKLGVRLNRNRTVETNEILQTNFPNIFCAGDVAGPYQFTHTASHQAWYASVNALFGKFKTFRADYRVIPWATYTDPEVARVGLNELEALEKGVEYEVTRFGIDDLDRAICDSEDHGVVKILTKPKSDKILGVTIVGAHASDTIAEYILAMKQGIGLNKILSTIHIYPTLAEANKSAAGVWKKNHAPEKALQWMERFHAWMRG
ncbi:FAD-dependent oxidoreductase [Desulfococcaceae bacterium HSG7]|nr:FAD-dependent oxidoreductase [Desulfococcaceae bacterium HSG7]